MTRTRCTPGEIADHFLAWLAEEQEAAKRWKLIDEDADTEPFPLEDEQLALLFETVFFSSLTPEEGTLARMSVLLTTSGLAELEEASGWFAYGLPPREMTVARLAKLSSVSKLGHSYIVVTPRPATTGFDIIGVARYIERPGQRGERFRLRVSAIGPGMLSIQHRQSGEVLRYEHGGIRTSPPSILFHARASPPPLVSLRRALLDDGEASDVLADELLFRLIRAMAYTRHGGILAFFEDEGSAREAAAKAAYPLTPPIDVGGAFRSALSMDAVLVDVMVQTEVHADYDGRSQPTEHDRHVLDQHQAKGAQLDTRLGCLVDIIGRGSSLDGAVVLDFSGRVYAFGAKLPRPGAAGIGKPVVIAGPQGAVEETFDFDAHGTRHLSAANFASSTDCIAFIASQDGRVAALVSHMDRVVYWPIPVPVPWG